MSTAHDYRQLEDDGFRPIGLGHNSAKALREMLQEQYVAQMRRADELLAAFDRLPEIGSDDTLGKVSDFVKQIAASMKTLEAARVAEKEPFLQAGRDVDGVFVTIKDKLEKARAAVNKRITAYLDEKRRQEEVRRQAEERQRAAEALKARQEAERKQREADEARRRAEEEARKEREARAAEARAAEERERQLREQAAEAERRAQEEAKKRRQSEENRAKAQAESERLQREAEAFRKKATEEAAERERQRVEQQRRDDERRAEEARQQAERDAAAEQARKDAENAEAQRLLAEQAATAKPADMARTRSELGSMATLQAVWTYSIEAGEEIDWNKLAPYLSADAKDKAIKAAIRNGVRPDAQGNQPLKGIKIFQTNKAAVR